MVSVAKLRRAQSGAEGMQLFADRYRSVLAHLLSGHAEHPFLTPRQEVRKVCYVLFVGNRGLCGTYNQAVVRFLAEHLHRDRPAIFDAIHTGKKLPEEKLAELREAIEAFKKTF